MVLSGVSFEPFDSPSPFLVRIGVLSLLVSPTMFITPYYKLGKENTDVRIWLDCDLPGQAAFLTSQVSHEVSFISSVPRCHECWIGLISNCQRSKRQAVKFDFSVGGTSPGHHRRPLGPAVSGLQRIPEATPEGLGPDPLMAGALILPPVGRIGRIGLLLLSSSLPTSVSMATGVRY